MMSTAQNNKPIPTAATQLDQERRRLIDHLLTGETMDFLEQNSRLLDDYFRERFEQSMVGPQLGLIKNPYVMIALGGYGRGEQCVFSDVDLLVLFEKKVPPNADQLVREVIYPLWDIGLDVGYATRSVKECLTLARKDYEVLTSLLDARFICGMSNLYTRLMEDTRSKILVRRSGDIIRWLIESNQERHISQGDSTYRLEPNLKEGQGGLRDYHTMMWIARIKSNIKEPRDLEYNGFLSHEEYQSLDEALRFVWDVRNRLHQRTGRKCDHLYFEHQIELAREMGYEAMDGQQPVEVFLSRLHEQMDFIKDLHLMFLYEQGYTANRRRRRKRNVTPKEKALVIKRDRLAFVSPEVILESPRLLIDIFEESARLKIPLGQEAKRLVREFEFLVNEDFSSDPVILRAFERILKTSAPVFNVLEEMLSCGFIERFIPEFSSIAHRIQYDEYHVYPVDKHSLRVVQTIKQFGTAEDPTIDSLCGDLYKSLPDRKLLLWAALLHDIGKGEPGKNHSEQGAAIVRNILSAKNYSAREIAIVEQLVRHHLLLVVTASRRDINDEETAISCARKISDARVLKMLYLLTIADCMSTGPKAWTEWTAALLRDFFFKVLNILERGELASGEVVSLVESKKDAILATGKTEDDRKRLDFLYSMMSPRYLIATPADQIVEHISLFQDLGAEPFVWKVDTTSDEEVRTVTICANDRPGLFSKIAGVLTLNSSDILSTDVFTWRNNIALDIFTVTAPPDKIFETERWQRTQENLKDALSGNLDLTAELNDKIKTIRNHKPKPMDRPNRVVVDNDSSSFFTIVEVFTYDFPGLLFCITDALLACRLDIWVAKIATYVDQVVDVFYVRDFDGQKVDAAEQVNIILKAVEEVLPGNKRLRG